VTGRTEIDKVKDEEVDDGFLWQSVSKVKTSQPNLSVGGDPQTNPHNTSFTDPAGHPSAKNRIGRSLSGPDMFSYRFIGLL